MAFSTYDKLKHSTRYWLLRRLPACEQVVEKLSQSMERKLTMRERIDVKLHLWVCAWCQWYLEHLHIIRDVARAKADEPPDLTAAPALSPEARERIKRRLTGEN